MRAQMEASGCDHCRSSAVGCSSSARKSISDARVTIKRHGDTEARRKSFETPCLRGSCTEETFIENTRGRAVSKKLLVVSTTVLALTVALLVQTHAQDRVTSVPSGGTPVVPDSQVNGPVPRMPDGHPDLSGPWLGGGSNADIEREGGLKTGELPLLPWAKELRDKRKEQDEPYVACTPMSVPRINPFPWKMVYSLTPKGVTEIYILHELGDGGAHRVVYMDGRKHPDDVFPTWYGHSIGRWEGDTLVIDTVGYNDKFWFDSRGTPHTEKLHTIERFSD